MGNIYICFLIEKTFSGQARRGVAPPLLPDSYAHDNSSHCFIQNCQLKIPTTYK